MQRLGRPHQHRFRFSNPLMQPYVLMRGLESGLLDMKDVAVFTTGLRQEAEGS